MLRLGLFRLGLFVATALSLLAACSDDDSASTTGPAGPTSGPGAGPGGAGGAGAGTGTGGAGGGIPDTECSAPALAAVQVYATSMELTDLVAVGSRFMASGPRGYVRFDQDGGNADATPTLLADGQNVLNDEGAGVVGVAGGGDGYVAYQRFDENGHVTGPRTMAFDDVNGIAAAMTDAGDSVVVWGWGGQLSANHLSADDFPGTSFTVQGGAYTAAFQLRAADGPEAIGVAWYGSSVGEKQTRFLQVSASGVVGEPMVVYDTLTQHSLNAMAATDDGYMVLVTGEQPDLTPWLIALDGTGDVTAGPTRLDGASLGHDLVSRGDTIAVIAGRATGEPQLRVFDLQLEPLGPWVCLDTDHNAGVPAAIALDGAGYAALYEASTGAVMLSRVGADGTGAP